MTRLVASGVAILGVSLLAVLGGDRAGKVYDSQNGSGNPGSPASSAERP